MWTILKSIFNLNQYICHSILLVLKVALLVYGIFWGTTESYAGLEWMCWLFQDNLVVEVCRSGGYI